MARSADAATRATRDAANASALAVIVYAILWFISTQIAAIRELSPFADDPWDAVASYAAIFLPVVAGATWIRSLSHREPVLAPAIGRRIRWGSALAAAIVLVAAAVDAQAIATIGFPPGAGAAAGILTTLVIVSLALSVVALVLAVRASSVDHAEIGGWTREPDVVDDLLALAVEAAEPVGLRRPTERLAHAVERFLDRSRLSPRRHRLLFGVALALLAAVAFDTWHAIREGPWANPGVAVLFGTLVAGGVLAVYLGTVVPLRLLRPPRP